MLCDKINSPIINIAHKLNIETFQINKKELNNFFRYKKFDLIVLANFSQVLNTEITKNNLVLNIQPSLLPKYKTQKAIQKAFLNKDSDIGITIYKAEGKLWEGEIIYQKKLKIDHKYDLRKFEKEILKQEYYYYPRVINKFLGLNVLVIGSRANDHAIIQKISESKFLNKLYIANSNDSFLNLGENITYNNYRNLAKQIIEKNIDFVIINNEFYFKKEMVDVLRKYKIKVIGANKKIAKLENSKYFSKNF